MLCVLIGYGRVLVRWRTEVQGYLTYAESGWGEDC